MSGEAETNAIVNLLATADIIALVEKVRADERARIVAALKQRGELNGYAYVYAELIESGEI